MTIQKLAYLAGIIDGEGTLSITYHKQTGHRLVLSVANTNENLMWWLKENFGGLVYRRKSYNEGWKTRYEWIMPMYRMGELLNDLDEYLILKRPQLQIAQLFRSTFPSRNREKHAKALKTREFCREEMKELNKKGKRV